MKKPRLANAVCNSLLCVGMVQSTSHAATLTVNSNGDSYNGAGCELREAVEAINLGANSGGCNNINPAQSFGSNDQVLINPESLINSTITLQRGEISINKSLTISATDTLTIDGNQQSRIFYIEDSAVSLNNLTIINGFSINNGGGISGEDSAIFINNSTISGNSSEGFGGGVFGPSVSITNSTISGNSSERFGGGVSGGAGESSFSITNSTISGNSSFFNGGGVHGATVSSSVSIINSTISGNSSESAGGGVIGTSISITNSTISGNSGDNSGGGVLGSSISIINSTISENFSSRDGGGIIVYSLLSSINSTFGNNATENSGGNISGDDGSEINFENSIVAGARSGGDCVLNAGILNIDSATIIQDGSCNTSRAIDPLIGPLADNGGSTLTHALLPNSPARNTGILAHCETQDQRGQIRDDGDGACDVGAIEFNPDDDFGEVDASFYVIPLPGGKTAVITL